MQSSRVSPRPTGRETAVRDDDTRAMVTATGQGIQPPVRLHRLTRARGVPQPPQARCSKGINSLQRPVPRRARACGPSSRPPPRPPLPPRRHL